MTSKNYHQNKEYRGGRGGVCGRINGTEGGEEGCVGMPEEGMKIIHKVMGNLNPNKHINTGQITRQNTTK